MMFQAAKRTKSSARSWRGTCSFSVRPDHSSRELGTLQSYPNTLEPIGAPGG